MSIIWASKHIIYLPDEQLRCSDLVPVSPLVNIDLTIKEALFVDNP